MANLRVDKIATGTANYQGSIYASGAGTYLLTKTTAPGTDDFTIEFWINSNDASGGSQEGVFGINAQAGGFQGGTGNQIRLSQGRYGGGGTNGGLEVDINGTSVGTGNGNDIIQEGTWYHVAVTRASGTVKIWVDGVEKASGSAAGNVTGTTFVTGYYDSNYTFQGYMSNFRYRKGTAYYTTTFTPPTGPLERTTDTELIFAQSVNNVSNGYSSAIHGGTTDIMQVFGNVTANTSAPTLTTSSSVGVVFEGDTKINSKNYMYFPTGDTSQRGRGRGLYGGGSAGTGNDYTDIVYLNIQSTGNTIQFGDLSSANRTWIQGMGSATRAIWAGGSNSQGPSRTNIIEYVTIATTGDGTDFGDALETTGWTGSHSNSTRGLTAGGGPGNLNTIGYITIATTGDALEFGDLTTRRRGVGRMGSATRFIAAGGMDPSAISEVMDYVQIATTGNATDFGNLVAAGRHDSGGCSSGTRGIIAGGQAPANTNTIQYVTIASTGNAADFGDLPVVQGACGSLDNSIRGVFTGNYNPAQSNVTSFITIASTGNAYDFGDYAQSARYGQGGTSDSHGGL